MNIHRELYIRKLVSEDWQSVRSIYIEGINSRNATFETNAPDWKEWDRRHLHITRLVATVDAQIVGWAALTPVSQRSVYKGVAEVSLYVTVSYQGKGVGSRLLKELITQSEKEGIWTLQASIFPENESSIHLHKKYGFRLVGLREKLGQLDGLWRDVVLLERRSQKF